jgi:hypothetical protein
MFYLHRHTRLTAWIVALLLSVSSSGFTTVLHSCLMAERSCCNPSMMTHMPIDRRAGTGNQVLESSMSCCATAVAGGLNSNPIVTGHQSPAHQHLDLLALLPIAEGSGAHYVCSHHILLARSAAASPHPVEKYVLNASFLI